jgi:multidrug efflux system membrane fusion protein
MASHLSKLRPLARAISGLAIVAALGCSEEAPPPELPARAIQWLRVADSAADEQRVLSGVVTAISETRLAFEVGGSVKTVEVNLGDAVTQEQVLARLDPEPFDLAVDGARSELDQQQALLASSRADYERTKKLYESKVSSRQELDRATALSQSRASSVAAAKTRLERAQRDRRRSVLVAPFAGSISLRQIDPAMEVAGGQVVFEMDRADSGLRVEVQMPETLIDRVKQGDPVEVGFPSVRDAGATARRFAATVHEVGTRAGVGNAFPVHVDLTERPPGVRPGMTAEVFFALPHEAEGVVRSEAILIPLDAALPELDDRFSVFVFDAATSTVQKRPIRTAGTRENQIAVVEGLTAGDVIATAGVSFLSDGQAVKLLDERLNRTDR